MYGEDILYEYALARKYMQPVRNLDLLPSPIKFIFSFQYTLVIQAHAKTAQYATNREMGSRVSVQMNTRVKPVKKRVSFSLE